MSTKLAYRDGGKTSEEGIQKIIGSLLSKDGVVVDCLPVEAGTPDNTVRIAVGSEIAIAYGGPLTTRPNYYYYGWVTTEESVTITSNSSGNARIDAIVAYIDMTVVDDTNNDNPGVLKFADVQGTPAGSPVAPNASTIVTAIGSGNPYVILAYVAVANGFSSITNSDITDMRSYASCNILNGGWSYANETWTYVSANTFTVPGDVTNKYPVGAKIKLTQTTVKYFYVVGVSYSSGTGLTTVTITGGTDYTLANAAITNNYYSILENAVGFPYYFNFAATMTGGGSMTVSNVNNIKTYFWITGKIFNFSIYASYTLSGSASNYIIVSNFPVSNAALYGSICVSIYDTGGSTTAGCAEYNNSSTSFRFHLYNAGNFTLDSSRQLWSNGSFHI